MSRTLAETPAEQIRPPRLLTGEDLLEMGYKPGPIFSEILRNVEDAQLEGELKTKRDAAEYVRVKFGGAKRQTANRGYT